MTLVKFKVYFLILLLLVLAGCKASGNQRAPIEQRNANGRQAVVDDRDTSSKKSAVSGKKSSQNDQDNRPQIYVVQKGDTLYSIAFDHGLDYREVAEKNNIENPSAIQIGQQIKLLPAEDVVSERPRIDSKPYLPPQVMISKKDQPKLIKLPYSETAVAQIEKNLEGQSQQPIPVVVTPTVETPIKESEVASDDGLEWGVPTKGKVIGEYSESANRKGIDIAGTKGQPVLASASGKVVYSGSGLRGYGKLVIIKHNKTFLSAYAHNEQILVKEGQSVTKGQKIAEMGSSDADQVKLHFEIRKFGKPIDPAKFLNLTKS
jgi:lipoprotein NlpD